MELLTDKERLIVERWAKYKQFAKKYNNLNPLEYLRLLYGEVFFEDLENILAMDDLIEDSQRMQTDLATQTKEFWAKMKKQGKDFNRLS